MADCALSFTFSKSPETLKAGDELQGQVIVKVDATCKCDGLTLAAEWRTSGKGNATTGQAEKVTLFTGTWEPGEYRYPFTYKAPVGPLTYAGQFLQIRWALMARADVPWAIDPKAEAPFVLSASPSDTAPYYFGPLYKPPDPATTGVSETPGGGKLVKKPMGLVAKLVIGAVILLIGGSMIFAIPFMAALFAPFIIFFVVKNAMVKSKLGVPDVKFFPNPVCAGQEFSVIARLNPTKDVKFGELYAELLGQERVVSGSGKHSHTHIHKLHQFRHPFPVAQREVRAGENVDLRAKLTLPPNSPLTFSAMSNNVEWTVKVSIELLGWPDWNKSFPVTVRPGTVSEAGSRFALR